MLDSVSVKVYFGYFDRLGPEYELVAYKKHDKQDKADVCGEEVAGAPLHEDGEAVGQEDEDAEEEPEPRQVRLQRRSVRQLPPGDPPGLERLHKAQVADADAGPGDKTGNSCDVEQPVEHVAAVRRQVEEGQEADRRGDAHREVRGAVLVGTAQEGRCVMFRGQAHEDSAAGVHVGVGGGQHGGQQDGVDDVREDGHAG